MDVGASSAVSLDYVSTVDTSTPTPDCHDVKFVDRPENLSSQIPYTDGEEFSSSGREVVRASDRPLNLAHGTMLRTPFRDCLNTFGTFAHHTFQKPDHGFVDGYIKVKWSNSDGSLSQPAQPVHTGYMAHITGPRVSEVTDSGSPLVTSPEENEVLVSRGSSPRLLPDQFGLMTKMKLVDRRFWDFYIKNWCPGRSILNRSNLWLNDFAGMISVPAVRAAIQCLAGTYIYDYAPTPNVAKRVNLLFEVAEVRLRELINYFAFTETLAEDDCNELVAIASVLSMQDIVMFERRIKKSMHPRWWIGFSQAAQCLKASDTGERYWKRSNMQVSSLRIAQSIVVCRAVIISQPMMELTKPEDFMPVKEAERYDWLLDDTLQGMVEIQGGCGFSKKLLLVFNHITYLSALMQQEPRSFLTPITIQHEQAKLERMKQWSPETRSWEEASRLPQHIEWVRGVKAGYKIDDGQEMTEVTAECWRIAAMIYLQCRALRLPRNHGEVLGNIEDLASCIRIMPTSGSYFTAQAPLFPVFLLGVVATEPHHRRVSQMWFESVVRTPVRSSVPPLYEVLQRIWGWVDREIPIDNEEVPSDISERTAWWEKLVALVREQEQETLCLT